MTKPTKLDKESRVVTHTLSNGYEYY